MRETINAYEVITGTREFRELERLRSQARHNEVAALRHAREEERAKWETVVAGKDAAYTKALADKDTALADKDALIAELRARLGNV